MTNKPRKSNEAPQLNFSLHIEHGDIWLTQDQLAQIFDTTQENISTHIANIYADRELAPKRTHKEILLVRSEGDREVKRVIDHYNFDVFAAIGYRVQSPAADKFRNWATRQLKKSTGKGTATRRKRLGLIQRFKNWCRRRG